MTKCKKGHTLPPCEECAKEAEQARAEFVQGVKMGIKRALLVPAVIIILSIVAWVIRLGG